MISADMEPLLFLCLLTLSGLTFGDQSGTSSNVTVMEDDDAILSCSIGSNTNIVSEMFHWKKEGTDPRKEVFFYVKGSHSNNGQKGQDEQFEGRVSHFPEELKHGNASIKIKKVTLHDKGNYTCIFPNTQSGDKIFNIDLVVGAAPEPRVTILEPGLLQCEVQRAFPEPTVEWLDSNNQTIRSEVVKKDTDRDRLFYITIQTPLPKTGLYRCVSTQKDIWHQISSGIYVPDVSDPTGWIVAAVVSVLLVGVLVGVLLAFLKAKGYICKKGGVV